MAGQKSIYSKPGSSGWINVIEIASDPRLDADHPTNGVPIPRLFTRIRDEGTGNLVRAALAAGAKRLVAQSIAWAYAPGPLPHVEDDPLDVGATGGRAVSVGGVVALENYVLRTPGLDGVVLRYGQLYGPETGFDGPNGSMPLHVDAAAHAAFLALGKGSPGAFNIAERNGEASIAKAVSELGWRAEFRLEDVLGRVAQRASPPRSLR